MSSVERPRPTFSNPLPGIVLGDPFALRWRGRFYLYGTNDGPPLADGRQVPVFRSDDLVRWEPLGGALEPIEPTLDHWAPEVLAWNGRFFMVVSFGDVDRRGHELWVAVADRPEGPFRMARRVSDPSEAFSIDGSWLLDDDGRLYLFRCLDFVEPGPPHGTGIVVQPMLDPLTPAGPPSTVLRAHSPWHLFEADRAMPLYGGRTFPAWTTIEGPAPVRRAGRVFCGYSGGNYAKAYGTGEAVADAPLGPYQDLRGREGPLFGTTPGLVEGPGHFSVIRPDLISDWIVLHGRSPGESGRRVWLCPAHWTPDGVEIGPLTDRPQPSPPSPAFLSRFDGQGGPPPGWRVEAGDWVQGEGEWHHRGPVGSVGLAWLDEPSALPDRWAVEAHLRFPEAGDGEAGLAFRSGSTTWRIVLRPAEGRGSVFECEAERATFGLPTLGDEPFEPSRFHALDARVDRGLLVARLDGVVVATTPTFPVSPARLGLYSTGGVAFDAVSIADAGRP